MQPPPLREVEEHVLAIIRAYLEDNDYPPTVREIKERARLSSTSHVKYLLDALERKGRIRRVPDISRGIEIVDVIESRPSVLRLPLIGGISAGTGILAFQEPSDYFVTSDVASGGDYALRVHGFSMIGDNITDGDVVLVREQTTALAGEIAVVLMLGANHGVDDEVTLKRIGSQPMLMPDGTVKVKVEASNRGKGYSFLVDADRIRIQGKVVGVIRRLA